MTRNEFESFFGTEEQCQHYLFNKRYPIGFICSKCTHEECFNISSRNLYQCKKCNHQSSLTAGTMIDKTRTPLRNWFLTVYLMIYKDKKITIKKLRTSLAYIQPVSYNTAWEMRDKIRNVLENGDYNSLDDFFESDDFLFWNVLHP